MNHITHEILKCAFKVHTQLGPGLLESTYQACLYFELQKCNFHVIKEKPLPVVYEGVKLECGYRLDLVVNNKIIIEIKSVEAFAPIHTAQLLTYLKLSNKQLGLLINFNEIRLKDGIRRIVNGY